MTATTKIHRLSPADLVSDHLFSSAALSLWMHGIKEMHDAEGVSIADLQASAPLTEAECDDILVAFAADPDGDGNDMPTGRRPETPLGYDYSRCTSIADMRTVVMTDCLYRAVERLRPYAAWLVSEK